MPDIDPGVVTLVRTPPLLADDADILLDLSHADRVHDGGCSHLRYPDVGGIQLDVFSDTALGEPLAAVIPLDSMAKERLSAVSRLLIRNSKRQAPDDRLTSNQRRRLSHLLRACDGRVDGASHFQLAQALYGRRMVERRTWQDSPFRYATIRLIRDGAKLLNGGYRKLLSRRRAKLAISE
ncbi:DUF2285 domain-containing protein [Oryzicola mucosus]|nr:DUF2285 domain-containing protein [Oryzicola mucosus]